METSYDTALQDSLRRHFSQEEIDDVLPGYVLAEEKRRARERILFGLYIFLLLAGIVFLVPYAYTIPSLGRIFRAFGPFGDYIVAAVGLSILIFVPPLMKIGVFRKTRSVGLMTKEEKLRHYAGLIAQMRRIRP